MRQPGTESAVPFSMILTRLDEALSFCASLGLDKRVRHGRFGEYRRRIGRLLGHLRDRDMSLLPADILDDYRREVVPYRVAHIESMEFGDLTPYLRTCDPDIVRQKLKHVLGGPALPSDEDAASNQARNIQFELSLAAMLHNAGLNVQLGEHPDLLVRIERKAFYFECKRIFSMQKLSVRIEEAGNQLKRDVRDEWPSARGIVAVSLSRVLNPNDVAFQISTRAAGENGLANFLSQVSSHARPYYGRLFQTGLVVGIIFHAASDFENLEANRFDRGRLLRGETYIPPFSSYASELRHLESALQATAR